MKATEKSVLLSIMKTKILLSVFLLTGSLGFAQVTPSVGVSAGILSTGVRGDASQSLNQLLESTKGMVQTSDRTGFFAGMNVKIPVADGFSIEPAAYYSQKGYTISGDFGIKGLEFLGANAKAALQNQYIDIPVLLKANVGGLQIFAGPQVSYLVKSDLKTTAGVLGVNILNKTLDATDQFNRWDAGITGGIGYQFTNGFNIKASYDYGLTRMDANKSVNAYSRGIRLGIGIQF